MRRWAIAFVFVAALAAALRPRAAEPRPEPHRSRLYVALAGQDEVAEIDRATGKVAHRFAAARQPWSVVVSKDGRRLAAACSRSGQVRVWDVKSREPLWERAVEDGFNLRGLCFTP